MRTTFRSVLLLVVLAIVLTPVVAIAATAVGSVLQETPAPPAELGELYLAALGVAVSALMKGLTSLVGALNKAPAIVRTVAVTVISFGVTAVIKFTGVDVPVDITTWTDAVLQTLIIALSAMGFHAAAKAVTKPALA